MQNELANGSGSALGPVRKSGPLRPRSRHAHHAMSRSRTTSNCQVLDKPIWAQPKNVINSQANDGRECQETASRGSGMQNELPNGSGDAQGLGFENLARFAREPRCPRCGIRVSDDIKRSGAGLADLGAAQESKQPSSQ